MRHPIHQNKTMRDVRQTRAKIQHLTALGYHVKEMWECEWQHMIQSDNHLKEFVETLDIVTPLNPRKAFFGGRTNAIKLHHKVEENEQIHTATWFCCTRAQIWNASTPSVTQNSPKTTDISRYYGLVKCKILPPNYIIPYYHTGTTPNSYSHYAEHVRSNRYNSNPQTTKEVKPALIPLRNGPSQVSGPPSNFKRPLKRIMSSPMCTKYGISSNIQRNSFNHT